jgi:hypothetical protein
MSKTRKWLTDKEYKLVKTLLDAGLSIAKTQEVSGRSYGTVHRVDQSTSIEDYRRQVKAYNLQFAKVKADKEMEIEPEAKTQEETGRNLIEYRLTQIKVLLEKIVSQGEKLDR